MTVARDAVLEFAVWTTTSPATLAFTPVGTPKGVVVGIVSTASTNDVITGVTYGGVAMTRIGTIASTSTEPGRAYLYFLGAGIPTGAQTVSITHTGTAAEKWACVQTQTAATDSEIGASGTLNTQSVDPQIALNTGAVSSLRQSIIYNGTNAVANLTPVAGMETTIAATSHDFGSFITRFGEQTTAATGSYSIGYTGSGVDQAMVAVAVQEVQGVVAADPYPYIGGGYYPTEG